MQRRRKNTLTFPDRLTNEAERLRQEAKTKSPGQEQDELLRTARQAETAAHIDEWLASPWLEAAEVNGMQDMKASAEKLHAEADYAEQIASSATDQQKRELYVRLAAHF